MKNKKSKIFPPSIINFFWDKQYKLETDSYLAQKIMMLSYITSILMIFLISFGILSLNQNKLLVGSLDLLIAAIVIIVRIYILKNQNYSFYAYFIIIFLGLYFLFLIYSGGADYSGPFWAYTFPVSAIFLLGRKSGKYYIFIFLIIAIAIFLLDLANNVYSLNYKLRFVGSFSATSVVVYFFGYAKEKMQHVLIQKNDEINDTLNKLKKNEKALTEQEKHYRTLFEASNDAIFLIDEGVYIDCNPKALEMFGCKREEIIGKPPHVFSPEKQPDESLSKNKAFSKITDALNGKSQIFEWLHCKLDRTEFFAEVRLDMVELNNKKLLLAAVRDITERKIAEEQMQLAKENAEKSDRLKSDFLAQMSHEIRTPINTIMNYTSLLKMEFGTVVSEDNSESFVAIHSAAHRLLRTIDLILNISDLEAGSYKPKFEEVNLPVKILTPVINEFRQAAINKHLFLSLSYPTEKMFVSLLDSYTVYQAVANLVDNAIKYTEDGGIKLVLKEENETFVLIISDSGIGMSKEYLPKLFEVFSQEESGYTRKYEGNGLGLALVKNYCSLNKILIDVESEKGKGTKFILTIPKHAA
ncbi:MAG: PAS domain S-box protein [Ignavibacteriae bacterium]|nr:PAS domain S-box protein [Ignavibacteriota bacterium]